MSITWYGSQHETNPMCYAENLYMKDSNKEWYEVTEIVIPDITITDLGQDQFYGFDNITKVTIPNSVISIGSYAFYNCTNLTDVYYNGTIEDWCNIKFNDEYSNPMYYAEKIYMLDKNNEYYEVTEVIIPDTVTSIGKYQLSGFDNITKVIIPNSVTSIGYYAFYNCTSLESITLPFVGNKLDGTSNTHFGHIFGAGSYSNNSTYVPSSLKEVIITGGTSIGKLAFYGCTGLESITISNSVTSIGQSAFYECTSLINIEIPNSVTSIGSSAFYECTSLINIEIPNSVTSIGSSAFYECTSLTNVYYNGTIEEWCNITFISSYSNPMYYAENFYMLDENNEWYEVTEIVIPDTITSIDNQFYGFDNITKVIIPNSVTSIGMWAFYDCVSLESIEIPNSVTSIGQSAFEDCRSLTDVYYKGKIGAWCCNIRFSNEYSNPMYYAENFYMLDSSSAYYEVTEIVIPDIVTSIGQYQFYGFDNLTKVTISNNVTSIDSSAFENCTSLKEFYFDSKSLNCNNFNGFNYLEPSEKANDPHFSHEFIFGQLEVIGGQCTGIDEFTTTGGPISIGFKVNYDTDNLPVQDNMKSRSINDFKSTKYFDEYYDMPWDIGKIDTGKGLLVALITYDDGTQEKILLENVFENKKADDIIIIKEGIISQCSIEIAIVYELVMWAPGLLGIDDDYWMQWRINDFINIV